MAVKPKTLTETDALAEADSLSEAIGAGRLPKSGAKVFKRKNTNYHLDLMNALILIDKASAGDFRVELDDTDALSVWVFAGRAVIDGVLLAYAGETIDLAAYVSDTVYIYLEDDGEGAAQVTVATDATGWPATSHIKLAEVVVGAASIASTGITDRRLESSFSNALEFLYYDMEITSQGDTGTPSTITITTKDRHGQQIFFAAQKLLVQVTDQNDGENATNATIAAGANTTVSRVHTADKEIEFVSHTDGVFTITVTNATAETVTIRIGETKTGGKPGKHDVSLDVEHEEA